MSVWIHSAGTRTRPPDMFLLAPERNSCIHCQQQMLRLIDGGSRPRHVYESVREYVDACPFCGWWNYRFTGDSAPQSYNHEAFTGGSYSRKVVQGACAQLKELDLADVETPLHEVRQYLRAKYEARFSLDPILFEHTVASVFRNLGYQARVTAVSRDGGIDVILESPQGQLIGVQVKKTKNVITVSQIRELVGALILGGYTCGIFVTTSRFTPAGSNAASLATAHGIAVELVDATGFLEALEIENRASPYKSYVDWRESVGEFRSLTLCEFDQDSQNVRPIGPWSVL